MRAAAYWSPLASSGSHWTCYGKPAAGTMQKIASAIQALAALGLIAGPGDVRGRGTECRRSRLACLHASPMECR
jgi:hypothetical protein